MYGLDNASGVNVMPKIAPVGSATPLWFTEGGAGLAASYPGQDWFNMIQAELLNALAAGGVKPEKGKLNQLAEAIGKIVSSGKYATEKQLSDGLALKFDKTGGGVSGDIRATGVVLGSGLTVLNQGLTIELNFSESTPRLVTNVGSGYKRHELQNTSGILMHHGDFGFGGESPLIPVNSDLNTYSEVNQNINAIYTLAGDYINAPKKSLAGVLIVYCRKKGYTHDEITHVIIDGGIEYSRSRRAGVWSKWEEKYSTVNTVTDRNGYLKTTSNIEEMQSVPIGGTIIWNTSAPIPNNFWPNEGRAFSATEYPEAAKVFPSLKLPDDRGYGIRAADNGRGIDAGRTVGTYQEDAMQPIYGKVENSGSALFWTGNPIASGAFRRTENVGSHANTQTGSAQQSRGLEIDSSLVVRTASETRMKNVAKILITRMK